MALVSVS
ncbi:hypothetical protein CGLO_18183 [Colletotrichum gloeosporioides Cg-14]|nr:hypothetical protein CGLO_18183 [Colletotrichum gloeosporioides Cg-14]